MDQLIGIPLTLAADIGDIITTIVTLAIIVFSVIGSIAQGMKQSKSKSSGQPRPGASEQSQESAEAMAERRRRQLQELARRRREAQQGQSTAAPAAGSATIAEREERDRQRRRAEALARLPQKPHSPAPRQHEASQSQAHEDRQRVDRQRADGEAIRSRRAQQIAQEQQELKRQHQISRQRMAIAPGQPGHEATGQVHRHVSDTPKLANRRVNAHAQWLRGLGQVSPQALQRAIIIREVFDRPLALRDHTDPHHPL